MSEAFVDDGGGGAAQIRRSATAVAAVAVATVSLRRRLRREEPQGLQAGEGTKEKAVPWVVLLSQAWAEKRLDA